MNRKQQKRKYIDNLSNCSLERSRKYLMKISKPQSLTTDTRLSQSHFFNNSLLHKTNLTSSSQKYHPIPNSFQQQDSKETDFLKVKNLQLQQRVKRMSQQIKDLQDNKISLLKINQKYVTILNQYYRDLHTNKSNAQNSLLQSNSQNKSAPKLKQKISQSKNKEKSSDKQTLTTKQLSAELVLAELEKDHRNLSRHVLVMENQIKNYAVEMEKFNQIKAELLAVNHTTPKQLIAELQQTTEENRQLKKENNRLSFELQKAKTECQKLKKTKQSQTKNLSSNLQQTQKLKAQINKVLQESVDKSNSYEQRIYELELKCQKLEKQLRSEQLMTVKHGQKRKEIEIQRVEDVNDNAFLRSSLTELLDPKKHPLLKLDRSFVYKKKKQCSMSLSKTLNTFK